MELAPELESYWGAILDRSFGGGGAEGRGHGSRENIGGGDCAVPTTRSENDISGAINHQIGDGDGVDDGLRLSWPRLGGGGGGGREACSRHVGNGGVPN